MFGKNLKERNLIAGHFVLLFLNSKITCAIRWFESAFVFLKRNVDCMYIDAKTWIMGVTKALVS